MGIDGGIRSVMDSDMEIDLVTGSPADPDIDTDIGAGSPVDMGLDSDSDLWTLTWNSAWS